MAARWEEFFTDSEYRHRITEIADLYPEKKSLEISYSEIEYFDFEFAEYFLNRSYKATFMAERVLEKLTPPEKRVCIHLRVKNLPKDSKIEIRDLRSKHLGKFIAIEGLVRKATEVRPKMVDAVFQCMRCQAIIKEPQDGLIFKEPLECYKEQNGCQRTAASTKFKLHNLLVEGVKCNAQSVSLRTLKNRSFAADAEKNLNLPVQNVEPIIRLKINFAMNAEPILNRSKRFPIKL